MRILIYGAGVIGSLYAVLLDKAGIDVTVCARGRRLEALRTGGLRYLENGKIRKAEPKVTGCPDPGDRYDFIFLTVRENQLHQALRELADNRSDIVTFVNSAEDYREWEAVCGKGRILPAFPGAGGSIRDDVLDAGLTPSFLQPTTFGEISGKRSGRTEKLARIFRKAGIPFQIVSDMHLWQMCHLAMVVPIADAYYEAAVPERAGYDRALMRKTAGRIRRNLRFMKERFGSLSPAKMYLFLYVPEGFLSLGLSLVFRSSFGERFMYRHSVKAPDEMRELHGKFYGFIGGENVPSDT